jgi:hypothetical protein
MYKYSKSGPEGKGWWYQAWQARAQQRRSRAALALYNERELALLFGTRERSASAGFWVSASAISSILCPLCAHKNRHSPATWDSFQSLFVSQSCANFINFASSLRLKQFKFDLFLINCKKRAWNQTIFFLNYWILSSSFWSARERKSRERWYFKKKGCESERCFLGRIARRAFVPFYFAGWKPHLPALYIKK